MLTPIPDHWLINQYCQQFWLATQGFPLWLEKHPPHPWSSPRAGKVEILHQNPADLNLDFLVINHHKPLKTTHHFAAAKSNQLSDPNHSPNHLHLPQLLCPVIQPAPGIRVTHRSSGASSSEQRNTSPSRWLSRKTRFANFTTLGICLAEFQGTVAGRQGVPRGVDAKGCQIGPRVFCQGLVVSVPALYP